MSESTTILVDTLSLAEIASDAVATHAVDIAVRAGLTNEAAVAADEALDWQLVEEEAERLKLKKLGAAIKKVGSKVKAAVQKTATKVKAAVKKTGAKIKAAAKKVGDKIKKALAGPADSTGVPAVQATTLLYIAERLYKLSLSAGDRHSFSYQGMCVPASVIATFNRNSFLVWVLHVPALNAVVVAFRGTVNGANVKSDLDVGKKSCKLGAMSCGKAHGGFYKLWADIRSSVITSVNSFLAKNPSVKTVYPIGHSLGAAVAIIAGLDFANVYADRSSIKVKVVGWGVPRVGDGSFAAKFRSFPSLSVLRYRQWRKFLLFKQQDPVSLIPPAGWGFSQVGTEFPITCKTCKSWIKVHSIFEYQATFDRLQRSKVANC